MIFLLLAAAVPPSEAQMQSAYDLLTAVHADKVGLPVFNCAVEKADVAEPKASELGNMQAAMRRTEGIMKSCGVELGMKKVEALIRAKRPDLSVEDYRRLSAVPFSMASETAFVRIAHRYKVSLPHPTVAPPNMVQH